MAPAERLEQLPGPCPPAIRPPRACGMLHEEPPDRVALVAETRRACTDSTPAAAGDFRFRPAASTKMRARTLSVRPLSDFATTCSTARPGGGDVDRGRGRMQDDRAAGMVDEVAAAFPGEAVEARVERPTPASPADRRQSGESERPPAAASRPRPAGREVRTGGAPRDSGTAARHSRSASRNAAPRRAFRSRSGRARRSARPRSRSCRRRNAAGRESSS